MKKIANLFLLVITITFWASLLICVCMAAASCSVTKQTSKLESSEKKINDMVAAFSATAASTKTTVEAFDKNQVIKGDTLKINTILEPNKPFVISDPLFDGALNYDPLTRKLGGFIKPKDKPFNATGTRTITEQSKAVENGTLAVKGSTETAVKESNNNTDRSWINWNYFWLIIGALATAWFIVIGVKRKWFVKDKPTV